ncbi:MULTISPECIES: hydrolase [unclassified Streptomyces]|uniref:hydrolase n=1 Tax=unclassified Streptomyces TaxID=2593676 RepID=UPI002E2C20C2|nr:hydrolase [Streptomyces sp. NBC_00228]
MLRQLPPALWAVPYAGSRFPGSSAVADRPGLEAGANCQLFAYEVLRHFGLNPPDLRSSELWADMESTTRVAVARPLDLVLFNADDEAYGAHVGVWVEGGRVLHLCAEVGRPVVWEMGEFAARRRYRVLVGIKRVVGSPQPQPQPQSQSQPQPHRYPRPPGEAPPGL